ncbi:MAG: DinB family protein [Bryobacterales bacterium]|nr:DinB family protein [Bryobacteraceae bacterium]MDW8355652.1 DinB family protein [Bryobacterales bacterium]
MSTGQGQERTDLNLRLLVRLRDQALEVRRLASGLSEELLSRRPAPHQWSLKELVCHLHRVQQIFETRIEAMLAEEEPLIDPYDPEHDEEFFVLAAKPTAHALGHYLLGRERLLGRLRQLAPEQWRRSGRHPEFPHYDVQFQVEYMVYHEAHHIYQMLQRRALLESGAAEPF